MLSDRSVMVLVIDGNDGTGKTTLVLALRTLGYHVADRGIPTMATDATVPMQAVAGEVYVILDCAPELSRERLAGRGADLEEHFHTLSSLQYYRARFHVVAHELGALIVDASGTAEDTLVRTLEALRGAAVDTPHGERPS